MKVLSDAPALNSEERGLSLLSTFNSLAPEEVAGKSRGSLIDKAERSATDIKRDRRKVKAKIKARKAAGKEITFKKPKKKPEADLRPVDGNKAWLKNLRVTSKFMINASLRIHHRTILKKKVKTISLRSCITV